MGCYCNCHQQYDIGFARKCGTPKIGSSVSMGKWIKWPQIGVYTIFRDKSLDLFFTATEGAWVKIRHCYPIWKRCHTNKVALPKGKLVNKLIQV